jgi:hypothetical protein
MSEVEEAAGSVETVESVPPADPAAESEAAHNEAAASEAAAGAGDDLATVRELVLKAHPEVVPDLVQGSSVDELLASVEPARVAYQRVAEAVRSGGTGDGGRGTEDGGSGTGKPASAQPPAVPAGGANNVVDPSTLAPTTKIAQGLAERRRA